MQLDITVGYFKKPRVRPLLARAHVLGYQEFAGSNPAVFLLRGRRLIGRAPVVRTLPRSGPWLTVIVSSNLIARSSKGSSVGRTKVKNPSLATLPATAHE